MALVAIGAQAQERPTVDAARAALGTGDIRTARIDFAFREAIGESVTGRAALESSGTGRLHYQWPNKYRIEETRAGRPPAPAASYVWLEDGTTFTTWANLGGSRIRPNLTAARRTALRQGREQQAMIYLGAILMADAGFMTYESAGASIVVKGRHGGRLDLSLDAGRVSEARFRQARVARMIARPGGSSWDVPTEKQAVLMQLADLRQLGQAKIPHRLRAEYDEGWREVSIVSIVLNEPISAAMFAPAGR